MKEYTDFVGEQTIFLDLDKTKTIHISGGESKFEILPVEEFMDMIVLLRYLNTKRKMILNIMEGE